MPKVAVRTGLAPPPIVTAAAPPPPAPGPFAQPGGVCPHPRARAHRRYRLNRGAAFVAVAAAAAGHGQGGAAAEAARCTRPAKCFGCSSRPRVGRNSLAEPHRSALAEASTTVARRGPGARYIAIRNCQNNESTSTTVRESRIQVDSIEIHGLPKQLEQSPVPSVPRPCAQPDMIISSLAMDAIPLPRSAARVEHGERTAPIATSGPSPRGRAHTEEYNLTRIVFNKSAFVSRSSWPESVHWRRALFTLTYN